MAQRMESVAPPGGVMLSASTARLVESVALLGEPEIVQIKGAPEGVAARRLLGMGDQHRVIRRAASNLSVDDGKCRRSRACWNARSPAMAASWGLWDSQASANPASCAICPRPQPTVEPSCSPPSASRMPAISRSTWWPASCVQSPALVIWSATRQGPVYAFAWVGPTSRTCCCSMTYWASAILQRHCLPQIAPDARRRRVIALINAASLARRQPGLFIVEDAHWIDEVSESMVVELFAALAQTPSLVVITYRPEYRGPLARVANFQQVTLAPLDHSQTNVLVTQLLGDDPSVHTSSKQDFADIKTGRSGRLSAGRSGLECPISTGRPEVCTCKSSTIVDDLPSGCAPKGQKDSSPGQSEAPPWVSIL